MWRTCPTRKAVPACASPTPTSAKSSTRSTPARWSRRADGRHGRGSDRGAQLGLLPAARRRSNGGGQAFDAAMWGGVPGGYRNTINDNLVLILMIETLEGLKNADEIAKVPA
jgi:hypothetical protein